MSMNFFGKSDIGKSRQSNQDAFSIVKFGSDCALFVVCDGVGGADGGEIASSIACEVFIKTVGDLISSHFPSGKLPVPESTVKFVLTHALGNAHEAICDKARTNENLIDMSTTIVAMLLLDNRAYFLNVGDSRAYMITDERAVQITKDHSYVQDLIDHGKLDPSLANDHIHKNVITRSVGYSTNATPDLYKITLDERSTCTFLLCTDGLTNMVSDSDIVQIINGFGSLKSKTEKLINMSNDLGGYDNITVVVASVRN